MHGAALVAASRRRSGPPLLMGSIGSPMDRGRRTEASLHTSHPRSDAAISLWIPPFLFDVVSFSSRRHAACYAALDCSLASGSRRHCDWRRQ